MKSAEHWKQDEFGEAEFQEFSATVFRALVEEIQLDGIKEGLTRAAENICKSSEMVNRDRFACAESILTLRDNLRSL